MAEMLKETLARSMPSTSTTELKVTYCSVCGQPISKIINLLGKTRVVPVTCRCKVKELEKINGKLEYNKKKDTLDRVFGTRLSSKNTKDISFEKWNNSLGNMELKVLGYRYCNHFEKNLKGNIGFALSGNAGVGKSFLSLCIAKEIEKKGYTVLAITINDILDKLKESFNNSNRETQLNKILVAINSADLLILDDLGVETPSLWVNSVMYRLIDSRYMNGKPLIITTNLEDFNRYDEEGRINSRIAEMCKPIKVNDDDIRRVKAKAKGMDNSYTITSTLNSMNNHVDKPYSVSLNKDEDINYRKQVIIALNDFKNIFSEKAIVEFSTKDIDYITNIIENASDKKQALSGFINTVRNNSKSTKVREIVLDYIKYIK